MIDEYFPEGAEDVSLEMLEEEEEVEEEEEEEEMHYYEEDDIEIKDENREEFATYSFVWNRDSSIFDSLFADSWTCLF